MAQRKAVNNDTRKAEVGGNFVRIQIMERENDWARQGGRIDWDRVGEVNQIGSQVSGEFRKITIVPQISTDGVRLEVRDVYFQPAVGSEPGALCHLLLPWRDDEMDRGNFRVSQEATHKIECMALDARDLGRKGDGRHENLHDWPSCSSPAAKPGEVCAVLDSHSPRSNGI